MMWESSIGLWHKLLPASSQVYALSTKWGLSQTNSGEDDGGEGQNTTLFHTTSAAKRLCAVDDQNGKFLSTFWYYRRRRLDWKNSALKITIGHYSKRKMHPSIAAARRIRTCSQLLHGSVRTVRTSLKLQHRHFLIASMEPPFYPSINGLITYSIYWSHTDGVHSINTYHQNSKHLRSKWNCRS